MRQRPSEPWEAFTSGLQMWQDAMTQMQMTFLEQLQQFWDAWMSLANLDLSGQQGPGSFVDPWSSMLNRDVLHADWGGQRGLRSRAPGQIDQSAGARDWTEPAG